MIWLVLSILAIVGFGYLWLSARRMWGQIPTALGYDGPERRNY